MNPGLLSLLADQADAIASLRSLSHKVDDEYAIMSRLLRHAPVLFVVAGPERFEYVSPRWTEALGWSAKELTSQPWTNLIHPDDLARTVAARKAMLSGDDVTGFVNRYAHKDGRWIHLVWFAQAFDVSGKAYCLVGLCQDGQARCLWHQQPFCVDRCASETR